MVNAHSSHLAANAAACITRFEASQAFTALAMMQSCCSAMSKRHTTELNCALAWAITHAVPWCAYLAIVNATTGMSRPLRCNTHSSSDPAFSTTARTSQAYLLLQRKLLHNSQAFLQCCMRTKCSERTTIQLTCQMECMQRFGQHLRV